MSDKKQSSVEWLYNTIDDEIVSYLDGEINLNELSIAMLKIKEQAKAMHKEEVIEAYQQSWGERFKPTATANKYYNETILIYETKPKQSSIEWLESIIQHCQRFGTNVEQKDIEEAKAMHKEEIKDAFYYGLIDDLMITDNPSEESELYYNETFEK